MDNQPRQQFCTNCGQALTPGAAFCINCGAPISASPTNAQGQTPAVAQPGYIPPYAQTPPQAQDDPLLAALAAGALASQMGQSVQPQARRRRRPFSTLSGCGCILLVLVVLVGPFVGVALTSGQLHRIFTYIAGGIVAFFLLIILIVMLATKKGRETLFEIILGGLLGGDGG
jgi:hypothetical protein